MLEIFLKGGPLMYPILLCSVLALGIFFERLWSFFRMTRGNAVLVAEVEDLVRKQKIDEATIVCQRVGTPLARILLGALRSSGRSRDQIKTVVEEIGGRESAAFERYLGFLGTIATISPLLGLLGTVLGMIRAFTVIATQGMGTPATLGGGISEALITTAAGLSVAIPVILLHKYLTSRLDRTILAMEERSMRLVDLLGN
ncbi:MAG: MotA/TolQ/ExbB proton channel family protein [Syntrophotaleaceae bacterium]